MNIGARMALAMGMVLFCTTGRIMADHPKEHPAEHPAGGETQVSLDELGKFIESFIAKDGKLKGGFFTVYDPMAKKSLALTLVRVHKEKLCMLKGSTCFACADFKATDGTLYDLDFFVKHEGKTMMVTEISIHKEAGKERYGWTSKDNIWEKVPTGGAK